MVKLQEKYGDKVAAVSVSVGLPADQFYDKSQGFLKKEKASFINFFVEEDDWGDKFDASGVPAIFVYDQTGKRVAEFKDGFQYENGKKGKALGEGKAYHEVNKIVEKLVSK